MRRIAVLVALVAALTLAPLPSVARGAPRTLAATRTLDVVRGVSRTVAAPFALDFVGLSWSAGAEPEMRLLRAGGWGAWTHVHEEELPSRDGRTFSRLVPAGGATAFEIRGALRGVRAHLLNTTDGPRPLLLATRAPAQASHLAQPGVVSRAAWGADESLRFKADGTEDWPQAFYATKKLVVHHTATANNDPHPAATVRAIYRYHAVDLGYGDIGYNFLVDASGRVYKGRYSGSLGTTNADTPTGEDAQGRGVTAAHVGGWNSGTMGIAILGDYTTTAVSSAARATLVDHLAWEAERHGIDPLATEPFTNPVSGSTATKPNISGHRDWTATECPGTTFHQDLPSIRADVAMKISGGGAPDTTAPSTPSLTATAGRRAVNLVWSASTDAGGSGLAGYEVWRSTKSATSGFAKLTTTSARSHTDSGLRRGKTYWYYVVATDNAGNRSGPSNTASGTPT